MKIRIEVMLAMFAFVLFSHLASDSLATQAETDQGVYFVQSLSSMELAGTSESPFQNNRRSDMEYWTNTLWSYGTLDQPGDVYMQLGLVSSVRWAGRPMASPIGDTPSDSFRIAIRMDKPTDVSGTVYLPNKYDSKLMAYRFAIKADQFTAKRDDFLEVKFSHYRGLWNPRLTGAAWFRYQAGKVTKQLGQNDLAENNPNQNIRQQTQMELDRTLSLISGGMALSENLQLDRILSIDAGNDKQMFAVDQIEGITIDEFDWKLLVKDIEPQLDSLAKYIPADQHAMFVPSFQALVTLIETGFETAGPLLPLITERSESANTRERYQQQLGLPLGKIQKMLGPKLISTIAMTGSDPYFPTGTDVAVLFQTTDPGALKAAILATVTMSITDIEGVEKVNGTIGDISYLGHLSPDRRVSSYVATLDNVVVVTNSLAQLNRIVEVSKRPETALLKLHEYRFFRDRYRLGDDQETALIVITDQTIRRWSGPRWRIATSRRTQAAAVLANLHARYMQQLVAGVESPISVDIGSSIFELNPFTVVDHTASSSIYGTLEFQTPIIELDFDQVSLREKTGYENWRRGYQSNWTRAFDPIAIQLKFDSGSLATDLTVMPLIDNSEYRTMADFSLGAKLSSERNARHPEALTWMALALNPDSAGLKEWANLGTTFAKVNFMDWLGDAVIVFVDEDPIWADLKTAVEKNTESWDFMESNLHRLPVAIQFNVRSSIRLTAFLVGLRGFIEQTAPAMTTWATLRHRDTAYVKIGPSQDARNGLPDDINSKIALYYFASGDTLIFSLSDAVIKRAIDRRLDHKDNVTEGDESEPANAEGEVDEPKMPLLGENFAVQIKRNFAIGLIGPMDADYQRQMQRLAWAPIPILNEWKRTFPDRDPVEIDRLVWKRELSFPGGGYRWNEDFQTMESTIYGNPAAPKNGPHVAQLLGDFESGNFGLTFENNGLRARFNIQRPTKDRQ